MKACHPDSEQQEGERERKMIGYKQGEQYIRHGVEKQAAQIGICRLQSNHIHQYPSEINQGIHRIDHHQHCHDIQGAVDTREPHQCLIEQGKRIEKQGVERMAKSIVEHIEMAEHAVQIGVVARNMKQLEQLLALLIGIHGGGEERIKPGREYHVESHGSDHHDKHMPPLLTAYAKKLFQFHHHRFIDCPLLLHRQCKITGYFLSF